MNNTLSSTNVENLWVHFSKPLMSFIKKSVNNDQDAEDILQDVFCKIQNNINSLKADDKIHAWVYSITRNAITDFYRTHRFENYSSELFDDVPDDRLDSGLENANGEIAQCLKAMINLLPDKYKEAILLTEFQNLTQKELSQRLGLSLPGAKSRVQRARGKLKEMLFDCCNLEFDRLGNVIEYQDKKNRCKCC
ncbi:MAG: RNA polymerase sigma factor SigZ [Clostridia bacterium]|nr:RNA polymerase sigma factor SigZ [Clostridia bacterium]